MEKKTGKKLLILVLMIAGVAAACLIMLLGRDHLEDTEIDFLSDTDRDHDISPDPSVPGTAGSFPDLSIFGGSGALPFNANEVSETYLAGFMYDTADFLEMAPSFECLYRRDGRVEARFRRDMPNGETRYDIRYYDLDENAMETVTRKIDLEKLYTLDPECPDPADVCDGGSYYIYIYDRNDEVLKACGGFCPTNKEFNDMARVLNENLPGELVHDAEDYKKQWQFYNEMNGFCNFGIFTGYDGSLSEISGYTCIVIDPQNHDAKEIEEYKSYYRFVLGYINVGSLEDFRDYYNEYADLTLGEYENWDGESWVDVSDERWQKFIVDKLAPELLKKGIDGFFVDNCDVYYEYPTKENLRGLTVIMESLKAMDVPVFINGGDVFLDAYTADGGRLTDVADGINQESVFSKYDFENGSFGKQDEEDRQYILERLADYRSQGAYIWITEYTDDESLMRDIKLYCYEKEYGFYITDSIELDLRQN